MKQSERSKDQARLKRLRRAVIRQAEKISEQKKRIACQLAMIKERDHTLELIRSSDQRAIKMWQEAHPGNDLTWPDRGKMIFWLMEKVLQ